MDGVMEGREDGVVEGRMDGVVGSTMDGVVERMEGLGEVWIIWVVHEVW